MTEFYRDVASFKKAGDPAKQDLPFFTLIEPSYCQPGANDGHPPHDILAADALVANVYNAIRANNDLWEQTLLVVVAFDEHGGFFDHVTPPATVPPDYHQEEYSFDQLGVRVPVILVSPWVKNAVFPDTMDHTSLLKYLTGKWSLGPLGYRTQVAGTFDAAFVAAMRNDVLPSIVGSMPVPAMQRPPQLSEGEGEIGHDIDFAWTNSRYCCGVVLAAANCKLHCSQRKSDKSRDRGRPGTDRLSGRLELSQVSIGPPMVIFAE
jgi:Phosphoesterase family